MTIDVLPPNAEEELGSEVSAYRSFFGIDWNSGDLVDWSGEWSARNIERMLKKEGRARALEQVLTLPLRAAPITIKPGKGDSGEYEQVMGSLEQMADVSPLPLVIAQGAQSLIYRVVFHEKVFSVDRGVVEYEAVAWRPPDSCRLTRDKGTGRITGFQQTVPDQPAPVRIPRSKAVVWLHGASRDPVSGISEMEIAYRCFTDKQKIRFLWFAVFLEGAALGRIVALTQQGNEADVAKKLAKLKNAGVAAVSGVDSIETLSIADGASAAFKEAMAFLDSEAAQSVLAGFLDLTSAASSGRGSYALSKDVTDFFTQAQDANARELAGIARKDIVRPLVSLNRADGVVPDVAIGPISGATVQQTLDLLQSMLGSQQQGPVVAEFVEELTVRVAGMLDLDVDKLHAAIQRAKEAAATSPAAAASAPLHAVAEVGTQALQNAAAGRDPLARPA